MKLLEFFEDFYYRLRWFLRHDFIGFIMWGIIICIAVGVIFCLESKQILMEQRRKGV